MKLRLFAIPLILCMVLGMFSVPQAAQASSYGVAFVSSVVYMNVSANPAEVSFQFYAENNGTPVLYPATGTLQLAPNAAGSLYAGTVFPNSEFKGSVTILSSQQLVATAVQTPPTGGSVKVRMLSNGFDKGSDTMTVQTVRRTSAQDSVFSIQNADSVAATLTVKFLVPGSSTPVATDTVSHLPAGAAKFYDMGKTFTTTSGAVPATFDGSVVVSAVQEDANGNPTAVKGSVVASSSEFDLAASNNKAYAFNAVTSGSGTVWMPSAFCNYNQGLPGVGPIDTYYAIANSSDQPVKITVAYFDINGSHLYDDVSGNIGVGEKFVSNGCATTLPAPSKAPYSGSAKITAAWAGTPGTGNPTVVAVGKVSGKAYSSAFEGVPDPGYTKVALPYVRYVTGANWTNGKSQRVFLAIQNTGTTDWAANDVTVTFYDDAGNVKGTLKNPAAVKQGQKFNVDASSIDPNFGYWATTVGGGAVVQTTNGSLAVVARASTFDSGMNAQWVEDYLGIPIP